MGYPSPDLVVQDCLHRPWLVGADLDRFRQQVIDRQAQVRVAKGHPVVAIAESDPVDVLAAVLAVLAMQGTVVLGNPQWSAADWHRVMQMVPVTHGWGTPSGLESKPSVAIAPGWILIPTGGTSGRLKFAIHTWDTMMAAAAGVQAHFQGGPIHSCCVLPMYHVSGLMQAVRAWQSGGTLAIASYRQWLAQGPPSLPHSDFFLSLVPTQLQRLLEHPGSGWLAQLRAILLGGGPAWPTLLDRAQAAQLPLALTYGMTETAAQVATLYPQQFLAGQRHCGPVLPHCRITIVDDQGRSQLPGQVGQVQVQAMSQCLGYVSEQLERLPPDSPMVTDDVGYLDAHGQLHIVGRSSHKIISGGENIFPEVVEAAIRATDLVADVAVLGVPDGDWGEGVTAVYVPRAGQMIDPEAAHRFRDQMAIALQPHLSHVQYPKYWIPVAALPRTAQGKLQRQHLQAIAEAYLHRGRSW
jgi:O-succinylbenzoic acid--CoA ligase